MAALGYLSGGEKPTAARMNSLYREFDRRMALILGGIEDNGAVSNGKSFILAFAGVNGGNSGEDVGAVPRQLIGNPFFFTGGHTRYAHRVPGAINTAGAQISGVPWVVRPYDHAPFTAAAAAATVTATDTEKRIVTVTAAGSGSYGGLPQHAVTGLYAHSLEAHTRTIAGVRYYLQEAGAAVPEKHYRFAVAEIIMEGVSQVSMLSAWNKYSCFRIHNLNPVQAKVTFPGFSILLAPYQCKTVRRDIGAGGVASNYRTGFNYFFTFEAGDPRFFWFWPTYQLPQSDKALSRQFHSGQPIVSNGMVANNLTNPTLLYDWIAALDKRRESQIVSARPLAAWFHVDESIVWDAYPSNASKFGDPSQGGTLLGDLLHHKGTIKIKKVHKTLKAPGATTPLLEYDEFEFRGYATIVADFAAKNLTVTENASGNLQVVQGAGDPDWRYQLIPIGTNMFKRGETLASTVLLHNASTGVSVPYAIEAAIFEDQNYNGPGLTALSTTSPSLVFPRTVGQTGNTRSWYVPSPSAPGGVQSIVAVAFPYQTMATPSIPAAGRQKVMAGIHRVTVSDLLDLSYFGDKTLTTQDNQYCQFTNARLTLTGSGLILRYTERVKSYPLPSFNTAWYSDLSTDNPGKYTFTGAALDGFFEVPRVIKFRGHGWGYGDGGRETCAFFSPKTGRRGYGTSYSLGSRTLPAYSGEISSADGGDFSVHPVGSSESDIKVLRRADASQLNPLHVPPLPPVGRFWCFTDILETDEFFRINDPSRLTWMVLPLLMEHYNGMARAVNSLTTGSPLSYTALRWIVNGLPVALAPVISQIMPVDCFSNVTAGSSQASIYAQLGVPLLSATNFPATFHTLKQERRERQYVKITADVSVENLQSVNLFGSTWRHTFHARLRGGPNDVTLGPAEAFGEPGLVTLPPATADPNNYATFLRFGDMNGNGHFPEYNDFLNSSDINLNTAYAATRWVRINNVMDALAGLGFPFVFTEVFRPLILERLEKGSSFSRGPFHNLDKVVGPFTKDNTRTPTEMQALSNQAVLYYGNSISNHHLTPSLSRVTRENAFRPPNPGEVPTWKSAAPNYQVFDRTMLKSPAQTRGYLGFQVLLRTEADTNGLPLFSLQEFNSPAASVTDPVVHINFDGGEDWFRWRALDRQSLCHQAVSSGLIPSQRFMLAPRPFWYSEPEWWQSSAESMLFAWDNIAPFTNQNCPQRFRSGWAPKEIIAGAGLTMIEADAPSAAHPNGTAYRVIYDPTGALADLT